VCDLAVLRSSGVRVGGGPGVSAMFVTLEPSGALP